MKLILCPKCQDVVKGDYAPRTCKCGASGLQYLKDGLNAIYWGEAIPLGFANSTLVKAVNNQPATGMGRTFEAFVIPKDCPTFKKQCPHEWSGAYIAKDGFTCNQRCTKCGLTKPYSDV
ncbi:MAG: hypothetical protein WC315_00650 [Candidatus Omnitrophota bacterium]|jgi:hypothetical protein